MEGLKTSEVAARLTKFGYNELPSSKPKSIWLIGVDVMKEPMFLLLIGCAVLYMIVGDYREGIIMLCSISIIIFITFYQYQKTEKALDALKKLASPKALVLRDGVEIKISSRELVPDDILILNEGDRISADAVLIDSLNLTVNESMLTGESIAVSKFVSKEGSELTGLITADIALKGKMSSIEQERYEDFDARGQLILQEFIYDDDSLDYSTEIQAAYFNFSPQFLDLSQFKAKIGRSDIQLNGKIDNYLAYFLKDSLLTGNFNMNSTLLDLNEFMDDTESSTTETVVVDSTSSEPLPTNTCSAVTP